VTVPAVLTNDAAAAAEVSRDLENYRAQSGLSLRQFARVLGTSASRLSTYISAKVTPSAAILVRSKAIAELRPRLSETHALSIAQTARAIIHTNDEASRLRAFFEFIRGADESGIQALALLDQPKPTGTPRFDALLGGAAEYIATRYNRPAPNWAFAKDRYLHKAWWISPLPSARAEALKWTPAAFRARAIYISRHDLESY
jgi:transcriptional regulator with XRE-family HTH domain